MAKKTEVRNTGSPMHQFPWESSVLLQKGLRALGLPDSDNTLPVPGTSDASSEISVRGLPSVQERIETYIKELELFNAVFDLVGAETGTDQGRSDLVVRHILDSLAPWKDIAASLFATVRPKPLTHYSPKVPESGYVVADAGSGAGFPGIPLAIVFPSVHFVLVERMSKRCAFLENCAAILGLQNVSVCNSEIEKAPERFCDLAVFRAFRPLEHQIICSLFRMVSAGGFLAAWKAKKDKITEEMNGVRTDISGWVSMPVTVPFLEHEERHLVLIASAASPNPLQQESC